MRLLSHIKPILLNLFMIPVCLHANVGGMSGSNSFTIEGGNSTAPTYKIVSASSIGPAVFRGTVSALDSNDKNITFATYSDDNNDTIYPFFAAGSFDPDVMIPQVSATISGEIITAVTPSYGGMSVTEGFSSAPEIIISPSDGGGDNAEVTSTINGSGEITGFTVSSGGTSYTAADITIVAGPHFARIIDESSAYYGRCFLISGNSRTKLTLDMSNRADGEPSTASTYFPVGTLVEVVPAATLGSIFGSYTLDVSNWNSATSWRGTTGSSVDWVYVYDPTLGGYTRYVHISGGGRFGWYSRDKGASVKCNNTVIYPDEAFIITRRSSGTVTIESEIGLDDTPSQIYLPVSGDSFIANNPFGMDLLLTEIIPSTQIDDNDTVDTKFRAGDSSTDTDMDTITILSGSTWKKYWYKSGVNSAVTTIMKAGAKSGTGSVSASDLFIGSGSITALESCSDTAGSTTVTNYNDGNYTKISINGTTSNLTGFTITLSDIQGYMLSEDGANEVNATTGETVDTNGTGSVVYSNLSGNFEVVGGGNGYVVIEKQRDVNFKSDEGSPAWNIGNTGSGYNTSPKWYAVGGGGSGAYGTVNTSGTTFTVTAGGSGYTSAPQIVISGGGWRILTDITAVQDNLVVGASDGLIIYRGATGGVKSFIEAANPTAE
jgi:hypothetical protein